MLTAMICFGCTTENESIHSVSFSLDIWDCRNYPPAKITTNNGDPLRPVILKKPIEDYVGETNSSQK